MRRKNNKIKLLIFWMTKQLQTMKKKLRLLKKYPKRAQTFSPK